MSRNVRLLHCAPDDVFEVLSDGWLYPSWVVGASRMREVDETWPMAGAQLHHSFGVWPALINDKTVVEEFVPGRMMVMRARGWPIGEARVTIDVKARGDECVVRIQEEAIAGPGRFVPAPLMDIPLHWRNNETLHRLAYLAEGRAARRTAATTAEKEMAASGEEPSAALGGSEGTDAAPEAGGPAEREDGAMTRDEEQESAGRSGQSDWVDAATSIDAVEAGPADEPGESESLPPLGSASQSSDARDADPVLSDAESPVADDSPMDDTGSAGLDERVARGDEAGASAGTPEDSWNPMSGAGESEPIAPEADAGSVAPQAEAGAEDQSGDSSAEPAARQAAAAVKKPAPKPKRATPGTEEAPSP